MKAYNETYLNDAMEILGEAVDYAVNDYDIPISAFFDMFIISGIAREFEVGSPKYVAGMSGEELALEVLRRTGLDRVIKEAGKHYGRSREYWTGWILAYYQWRKGLGFEEILKEISAEEIIARYSTLHEASEEKCVEVFDQIIKDKAARSVSKLQHQRKLRGLSQQELAQKSEVNLRTLQQYEIRTKNINKASVDSVRNLARVLGCRVEDILETELNDLG